MKINSNIFERMMLIASNGGCKNTNDLSKMLGYKSPEKLYRLERDENAKPSVDILTDFANKFENVDMHWILTGELKEDLPSFEKYSTPNSIDDLTSASDKESAYNAPPTLANNAPPNAPPTLSFTHPQVIVVNESNEELIPIVSAKAAAGYLNGYADPEYIETLPTVKLPNFKGGTHRGFEIKGQSMNPTLHSSAIAIGRFEESFDVIKDRRIYILVTEEGILIKRVLNRVNQDGKLILLSDNQNKRDYPNIIIDAEQVYQIWYLRAALSFEFNEPSEMFNRFNDLEAQVTILQSQLQKLIK